MSMASDFMSFTKSEPLPTPQEVRDKLPLEWVIGHLWGLWGVGHTRVSCPSPDHGDSTPSFNLWAPNDFGVYTRFGCYGCGIRGDAIDVIRMKFGLDFHGALEKAEELLKLYETENFTPGVDNRPEVDPDQMQTFYDEICRDDTDLGPYWRLLNTKVLFHLQMYPHDEWKWTGHRGLLAISMPHYGPDGQLTGVKFRDRKESTKRWGIRGSRYPYLYGSWRAEGHANVVLCEGESDTVNAAFQLRGRACDVLGLPSGANGPITEEMVQQLSGKKVFLIFDGDQKGREAAERWHALPDFQSKIVDLPDDTDISNCGIPVTKLLKLKEK